MAKREEHSNEFYIDLYATFLPNDSLWNGKRINTTNLYKFLRANSNALKELFEKINNILVDLNPNESSAFVKEWENALGIPDGCIGIADTIEQRQKNVLLKLAGLKAETREDFINLAKLMGYNIDIYTIESRKYPPYNIPYFFNSSPPNRFTWVVSGTNIVNGYPPYNIPYIPEANDGGGSLKCIFNKLKPAFTRIIFYNRT